MPPDLALLSTLTGSNYPYLELNFMVPRCSNHLSSTVYANQDIKVLKRLGFETCNKFKQSESGEYKLYIFS